MFGNRLKYAKGLPMASVTVDPGTFIHSFQDKICLHSNGPLLAISKHGLINADMPW